MALQRRILFVTSWVDHACRIADARLTDFERRRLIAALLSRRHLILSGPAGIGKSRLARALTLSGVNGDESRLCMLQGHPWWATQTTNIGRFVELQTDFSLWRLANFVEYATNSELAAARNGSTARLSLHRMPTTTPVRSVQGRGPPKPEHSWVLGRPGRDVQAASDVCGYIAYVERMSPVEIELYFRVVAEWLLINVKGKGNSVPLRLIGTYDCDGPPELDERVLGVAALVNLRGMQHKNG